MRRQCRQAGRKVWLEGAQGAPGRLVRCKADGRVAVLFSERGEWAVRCAAGVRRRAGGCAEAGGEGQGGGAGGNRETFRG